MEGTPSVQERHYQAAAVDRSFERWAGGERATLVILPTGTGKTVVAGRAARRAIDRHGRRTLFLAHREELIRIAIDRGEARNGWSMPTPSPLFALFAVVGLVGSSVGCASESAPTIDCDTATVVSYSELRAVTYCTSCHGAGRADAGVRLDTYDGAVASADASADTIADGSMPENGALPDDVATEFYAWAQCGQPE